MPVKEKLLATCVTCFKFGVVIGTTLIGGLVGMSYEPMICEPTPIGNRYQILFGRGFGYSTISASKQHNANLAFQYYREYPFLINKDGIITNETVEKGLEYHKNKMGHILYERREYLRHKYRLTPGEILFFNNAQGKHSALIKTKFQIFLEGETKATGPLLLNDDCNFKKKTILSIIDESKG